MEKERRIKVLSLAALIIAVLGLTVAFAALSQTLTINGSANIDAATWDIHFENLYSDVIGTGVLNGTPDMEETSITGINATISKPNDEVIILFDVVNRGTINAKLDDVIIPTLCSLDSPIESCDWNNDGVVTQEDIDKVNNNITFTLRGNGGDDLVKKGDTLNKTHYDSMVLILGYYKLGDNGYGNQTESTELPKRDLTFNDLSITLKYVQAD